MKEFTEFFNTAFNSTDSMITLIVWGVYIGVMIGIALALVTRVHSHKLVGALIREKAGDPSTARSFEQLGIKKSLIYRIVFRKDGPVRKYVKFNGREMYIPEDKRIGAELRFSEERHPIMTFVFAAIVFFAAAMFASAYIPQLLEAYSKIGK